MAQGPIIPINPNAGKQQRQDGGSLPFNPTDSATTAPRNPNTSPPFNPNTGGVMPSTPMPQAPGYVPRNMRPQGPMGYSAPSGMGGGVGFLQNWLAGNRSPQQRNPQTPVQGNPFPNLDPRTGMRSIRDPNDPMNILNTDNRTIGSGYGDDAHTPESGMGGGEIRHAGMWGGSSERIPMQVMPMPAQITPEMRERMMQGGSSWGQYGDPGMWTPGERGGITGMGTGQPGDPVRSMPYQGQFHDMGPNNIGGGPRVPGAQYRGDFTAMPMPRQIPTGSERMAPPQMSGMEAIQRSMGPNFPQAGGQIDVPPMQSPTQQGPQVSSQPQQTGGGRPQRPQAGPQDTFGPQWRNFLGQMGTNRRQFGQMPQAQQDMFRQMYQGMNGGQGAGMQIIPMAQQSIASATSGYLNGQIPASVQGSGFNPQQVLQSLQGLYGNFGAGPNFQP